MDFRQLRYFLAVLDAGSFTAAARRLHVSQPALGYQVKQLEARHGLPLLERHSRGVTATAAGLLLAGHGRRILAEVEAAEAALSGLKTSPAGSLSLGVTPTPGRALAPGLVAMSAAGAGPRLTLREGLSDELARLVVEGTLDAALCYDPERIDPSRATPLYTEDLFLVGPPGVVGQGTDMSFADVARLPLVLDGSFQAGRRVIEAAARAATLTLDLIEAEAVTVKRELLVRHGRCSIVPLGLFYEEIRSGQLAARRVVAPEIARTLVLVTRRGLDARRRRALEAALLPLVADHIAAGELAWRQPAP
jgi:LysR family nitrogen assimilation transcriptional regulator